MRREGRQHGMVRTRPVVVLHSPLSNPNSKLPKNIIDRPPVAGVFDKVPTKPTNHSKFTGRCGRQACVDCRFSPTTKSKKKTKGSTKFKSALLVDELYDLDESPASEPEDDDDCYDDGEDEVVNLGDPITVEVDLIVAVEYSPSSVSDGYDDELELEMVVVEDSEEEEEEEEEEEWFVVDEFR